MAGVLVFAPFLLTVANARIQVLKSLHPGRMVEAAATTIKNDRCRFMRSEKYHSGDWHLSDERHRRRRKLRERNRGRT